MAAAAAVAVAHHRTRRVETRHARTARIIRIERHQGADRQPATAVHRQSSLSVRAEQTRRPADARNEGLETAKDATRERRPSLEEGATFIPIILEVVGECLGAAGPQGAKVIAELAKASASVSGEPANKCAMVVSKLAVANPTLPMTTPAMTASGNANGIMRRHNNQAPPSA